MRLLDAAALRDWAHSCVGDLITHTDEMNRLNVFPVADADTGTNMLFTMRSALAEANAAAGAGAASEPPGGDVARVAAALSAGALHGARGNSGVILSQILRGIADVTADAGVDLPAIDAALFAAALRHGVSLVVASMGGREIPGTAVSVLQAAAAAAERSAGAGADLAATVVTAAEAAAVALEKTTEQLDVLAAAGVVDAGGRGLLVLLDTLRLTVTGQATARRRYEPSPPEHAEPVLVPPGPQFEVMYLLTGADAAAVDALRDRLTRLGESVAVAASASGAGYSVHVHTDDAGAAVEAGLVAGRPSRIRISGLHGGAGRPPPGSWSRERAVLIVADGGCAAQLFADEGACVLRLDRDGNPGARQLLRAIVDTGAAQVVVLPNGYLAAEELVAGCTAAIGWGIEVVPVPTDSMVQGLAALAVHEPESPVVDDGYTMARAASAVRHGSVRIATAQALTFAGECRPGDGLGITGDEVLIVAEDVIAAAAGLVDLLLVAGGELVTVLVGDGVEAGTEIAGALERHLHDRHPGTELVVYHTGHRGDALLIGVE